MNFSTSSLARELVSTLTVYPNRWCRGNRRYRRGPSGTFTAMCLLDHIATRIEPWDREVLKPFEAAAGCAPGMLQEWNDNQHTVWDVIDVCRKVAEQ